MSKVQIIEHHPDHDPEIFRVKGNSLKKWLKIMPVSSSMRRGIVGENAPGVTRLLDRIVTTAKKSADSGEWTAWRMPNDNADRVRVFTPLFRIPQLDEKEQLTRLNLTLPTPTSLRPSLHIEKLLPGSCFEGQEIVWEPKDYVRPPLVSIVTPEGYADIHPEGEYSDFWVNTVKTVVAASAEFCPYVPQHLFQDRP